MNRPVTPLLSKSVRLRAVGALLSFAAAAAAPVSASRPEPAAPPTQPTRESVATRDDGVPRRLIAKFDFEENAVFPKEIPTGFYRGLARTDTDQAGQGVPQGGEQAIPGLRKFGRIEAVRGVGRAPA